jgi:hypothetical protein
MWTLCRYRVLTVTQNPDTGQFYTFRTMENLSWNVDQIVSDPTQI